MTLKWARRWNRKKASRASEAPETTQITPTAPEDIIAEHTQPPIAPQSQQEFSAVPEPLREPSTVPQPQHEPSPTAISRLEYDEAPAVDRDLVTGASFDSTKTLWDEAYDQVGKQNKTILNAYEKMVAHDLYDLHGQTERQASPGKNVGDEVHSLSFQVRRSEMEALLDSWANGSSRTRSDQSILPSGDSFISSFYRDSVLRSRERMSPGAVLPWVAACYASKAFQQPSPETHDANTNLVHVISRMEWYDRLQKLFTGEEENDAAYPQFLTRIKDLYAIILLYFMKMAICHSPGFSYGLQALTFIDDLDSQAVSKAEGALASFNEEQVDRPLRKLLEAPPAQVKVRNGLLDGLRVADPWPQLASSDPTQREMAKEIYHLLKDREEYKDFENWKKPECQLLWISGDHGQGKTKLLHGVIQALYKRSDSPGFAFFFFGHAGRDSDNAAAALRNLIWLIITRCSSLDKHLKVKLNTTERKQLDHPNDFLALSALFFNIIQDPEFPNMYLIIDSLDECKCHRTEFIDLIIQSTSVCSRIKWLASSMLEPEGPLWQHLALASDIHASYTAMHNYIKYMISILARDNSYDEELETSVTDRLCQLKIKNYLWVDIVCDLLKSKDLWRVEETLGQVETKRDLQGLYSLLHEIIDHQQRENPFGIDVLLTMGAVYQSLGLDELKRLMDWPPRVDMKTILQQCSGFLQLRGDMVLFRHESARDYARQCILDPAKRSKIHVRLTVLCLKYLGDSLGNDYTALPGFSSGHQVAVPTISGSYASLYWMKHLQQVTDVAQNTEVRKAVLSFLGKHFLLWVDALTQGDKLYLVASRLRDADMHLQKIDKKDNDLADAIRDAHLFLRLHIGTDGPNNLPASNTTIFCPEASLVKNSWAPTVHPWLRKLPQIDQTWSPNFTTFRGHKDRVRSISISSDGRVLASGSDDGTVRIWDTETGTTQHVFEVRKGTYSYVTLVAITSRILAAGPDDCPVVLWDILTGRKVRELPAYTMGADALCLSPEGGKIAVAVRRKVYIWSIEKLLDRSCLPEPIVYPIKALSLAFSQDDELIITSGDVIQLWNTNSSKVRQNFTSKTKKFTCAALGPRRSSGGRLLASGSAKGDICIWEIDANIEHLENVPIPATQPPDIEKKEGGIDGEDAPTATPSLEYRSDTGINSLAFSPSGSQLASSSSFAINIWDSSTMRRLNTLPARSLGSLGIIFDPLRGSYLISSDRAGVHFWYVNDKHGEAPPSQGLAKNCSIEGLALHPGGKVLAAVRSDHEVFLWDLESGSHGLPKMDFNHSDDLRSLVFSPNKGDKLLSTSDDRTAQVCDVATGKRLYSFKGHEDWVRFAAWSPDGGHVATASDDGTIRIWKIGNEEEPDALAILGQMHDGPYITAVAFSANGLYLISGDTDGNLIIWEKVSESKWQRKHEHLTGHTGVVASVLVTPDSKYVLSASTDQSLRGWDIESGEKIAQIKIDWVDFNMWWDLSGVPQGKTPNYVVTPQGAWLHHLPGAMNNQTMSRWRVRCDDNTNQWWITFNNEDIILIPREYSPRSSLVVGSKVIIGSVLERLYVLDFKTAIVTS